MGYVLFFSALLAWILAGVVAVMEGPMAIIFVLVIVGILLFLGSS